MAFVFERTGDVCRKMMYGTGRSLMVLTFLCMTVCAGCRREEPVLRFSREDSSGAPGVDVSETVDASDDTGAADDTGPADDTAPADQGENGTGAKKDDAVCAVFVCGAVRYPGVYYLPEGARAADAVDAAGGFGPDADREYLNLAAVVSDGQKLRVLTSEETARIPEEENMSAADGFLTADAGTGVTAEGAGAGADGLVNLNTAGKEQLMTLPGIGEARADAIIAWREEHGPFADPHDICNIPGIGEALYEKIRQDVKTVY